MDSKEKLSSLLDGTQSALQLGIITEKDLDGFVVDMIANKNGFGSIVNADCDQKQKERALVFMCREYLRPRLKTLLDTLAYYETSSYKNVNHPDPNDYGFWGLNIRALKSQLSFLKLSDTSGIGWYAFVSVVMAFRELLADCDNRKTFQARLESITSQCGEKAIECSQPDKLDKQLTGMCVALSYRIVRLINSKFFSQKHALLDKNPNYLLWVLINSWTDEYILRFAPQEDVLQDVMAGKMTKVDWLQMVQRTQGVDTTKVCSYGVKWRAIKEA